MATTIERISALNIKGISAFEMLALPSSHREFIFEYITDIRKQAMKESIDTLQANQTDNLADAPAFGDRFNPNINFNNRKK